MLKVKLLRCIGGDVLRHHLLDARRDDHNATPTLVALRQYVVELRMFCPASAQQSPRLETRASVHQAPSSSQQHGRLITLLPSLPHTNTARLATGSARTVLSALQYTTALDEQCISLLSVNERPAKPRRRQRHSLGLRFSFVRRTTYSRTCFTLMLYHEF